MAAQEQAPPWPTTMRTRLSDGRLIGTDNSVWLYRTVPLTPVVDAKSPQEALNAAEPMLAAFEELAAMTPVSMARRSVSKNNYRQIHVLLVNVPKLFEPDPEHKIAPFLAEAFPNTAMDRRMLLFGVRLRDKIGTGGLKSTIESVVETLVSGTTPLSDFDDDYRKVDAALTRSGFQTATSDDIRLANAWWNHGRFPDTPILPHDDHLHIFTNSDSMRMAHTAGVDKCDEWTQEIPNQHSISFAAAQDVELDFVNATSPQARWISSLLDSGVSVVSVRGSVEPATVTRGELRRQRKRYIDDINERVKHGKMERQEQSEMLGLLGSVEGLYATTGPPSLVGASILVGFNGQVPDISQAAPNSAAKLNLMAFRQPAALTETMLCSPMRANPYLHDMPAHMLACSGIQSLSRVGDREGALVGFTERDRQPAYLSPTAASTSDGLPLMLFAGATGSGKSVAMLHFATQFVKAGNPVIIIDPKAGSDHSAAILAAGGQVSSLDDLTLADGIFDPIRFSGNAQTGIELAASILLSINPWGTYKSDFETPLMKALAYGVSQGANCIIQALTKARDEAGAPDKMVQDVIDLASASAMFAACAGTSPQTEGLRVANGITLIKVGNAHLDLPSPGSAPDGSGQRIAMALVRMMVFGSAMALTGREGVVMLDEAWVFLGAGRSEVERLGRLARSQGVLPMLYTQRVSDAVNAGLSGYISRGIIGPIEDVGEAHAACDLFNIEATPERITRITAKATMGSNDGGTAPNWNSMRALVRRDHRTGEVTVLRGTVGIYADLSGRAIPVEITIPAEVLELASTNPEDIKRRAAAKRDAQLAAAEQSAASGFMDSATHLMPAAGPLPSAPMPMPIPVALPLPPLPTPLVEQGPEHFFGD